MACREGIDPADFQAGVLDPADSTDTSELVISDVTVDTQDPDGRAFARFTVGVSNVNFNNDITFRYSTANGTALSGQHYAAAVNVPATIPAGNVTVELDVQVFLVNAGGPWTGTKTFSVILSSPANATIDDGTGVATINYDALNGGGGGGGGNDWDAPQFTGWTEDNRVTYYQFSGCHYEGAATAYAAAAVMSALAAKQGLGKWRFNPQKLFDDMGGHNCCSGGCPGASPGTAVAWAKSHGVQRIDTHPNNVGGTNYSCQSRDVTADHSLFKLSNDSVELGGGGITKTNLLLAIKKAVAQNGAVDMASIFYDAWNTCRAADNYILRPVLGNQSSTEPFAEEVIAAAQTWLGNCYNLGGEQRCGGQSCPDGEHCPPGIDCSGLIYRIFNDTGHLGLVGGGRKLANGFTNYFAGLGAFTTDLSQRRRGDLISYQHHGGGGSATHIGIYLGSNKIISALINPWGVTKSDYNLEPSVTLYGVCRVPYPGAPALGSGSGGTGGDGDPEFPPGDPTDPEYTLDLGTSDATHAWAIIGWDDNYLVPNDPSIWGPMAGQRVGCFRIQSSHGCKWGVNGRGWIPYSYLSTTWPSGNGPRFRYWGLVWGGAA